MGRAPRRLARERLEVYAYFNNDWEGFAIRNALRLQQLLGVAPYAVAASLDVR